MHSQTHNKLKIKAQAILIAQTQCNTLTHHFHHFKSSGSVAGYKHVETAPSVIGRTICFSFTQSAWRLDGSTKRCGIIKCKIF